MFTEHRFAPGLGNTVMGECVMAFRDLGDPKRLGHPDFVKGEHWVDTSSNVDEGGVHTNLGVPNNAWYLMTLGGTNKTSGRSVKTADAIGWSASETLWFASNRSLFAGGTTFREAALAQIAYAKSTGLVRPSEPASDCAEKGPARVRAVACAWYAVGAIDFVELVETARSEAERDEWCAMMESCKGPNDRLPQVCAVERTSIRVSCGRDDADAAPPGRGPVADGGNALADGRDSCAGRVDGVYCSAIVPSSAIVCEGQQIAGGLQCLGEQRCVGPNGPGKDVQCR